MVGRVFTAHEKCPTWYPTLVTKTSVYLSEAEVALLALLAERLSMLAPRTQAAMARQLQRDALRLRSIARSLEAVSPLATVARGYSILTRADDGALVRSTTQVQAGDTLHARVGDGTVDVQVIASP